MSNKICPSCRRTGSRKRRRKEQTPTHTHTPGPERANPEMARVKKNKTEADDTEQNQRNGRKENLNQATKTKPTSPKACAGPNPPTKRSTHEMLHRMRMQLIEKKRIHNRMHPWTKNSKKMQNPTQLPILATHKRPTGEKL